MLHPAALLFILNLMDTLLTIFWIRQEIAPEANRLMGLLIEAGELKFLFVKLAIGLIASIILWRWEKLKLARYGLLLALTIYLFVIVIHFAIAMIAINVI
ncbi:MAG: hypothetical protein D6735_15075 [Acidobacteria bacterium]|nr:MAG: hypothetical protein D6735_15075 [Acidobacteriota bacterium]